MESRQPKRVPAALTPNFAVVVLSILWALAWLIAGSRPRTDVSSFAQTQTALFAIFAAISSALAFLRRTKFPRGRHALAAAAIGVGLFVIPAALVQLAQRWISTLSAVTVFSLTPVFAVVLEPYLQGELPQQAKAALAAALVSVAGALFIFPLDVPGSLLAALAMCALVAAAFTVAVFNCLAIRFARDPLSSSILPMAAEAGAASAICFALAAVFAPGNPLLRFPSPTQLLPLLLIDLLALFLLFWLMPRLAASRMSTRFILAPLIAVSVGTALEQSSPPLRAWIGMALLASGGCWLLFAPPQEP